MITFELGRVKTKYDLRNGFMHILTKGENHGYEHLLMICANQFVHYCL